MSVGISVMGFLARKDNRRTSEECSCIAFIRLFIVLRNGFNNSSPSKRSATIRKIVTAKFPIRWIYICDKKVEKPNK